jgi:hypothetical protein
MTTRITATRLFPGLSVLLWATAFATAGMAQTPAPAPPPQTSQLTIVHVKPDMGAAWQEYLKNDANPAVVKSGVTRRQVWTTATLGEGGEYLIVTPVPDLSQLDEPTPLFKAIGQEGQAALMAKRQRLIIDSRSMLITARPELGVAAAPDYQAKLGVSSRTIVAQGHTADFLKNTKELSAVIAKTNAKGVYVNQVGIGGNPNEFITLVLFDSFADINNFPAAYAKAAAEAKLTPAPAGTVVNTEWRAYRYARELSIIPPR